MVSSKISPFKAILICINSMIGAGLFISARPLTQYAGAFGFLDYILAACILFPLILCIAELASLHPVAGGLYVYSRTYLGQWPGFISGWGYFVGKTTSAAVLMHNFVNFFYIRIHALQAVPLLLLDCLMLFSIVAINSAGVSIGGRIQYFFTILKMIPILFAFGVGFVYCDLRNFKDLLDLQSIIYAIPIAIFPLLGFEVICAVANMVEGAQQNIRRILITAFLLVAAIDISFQFITFGILGNNLKDIHEPILTLGLKVLANYPLLASAINGAVFASIIGACFSLLTSNCWNLHTIARYGHLPAGSLLTKLNKFNVPWVSLLVEAAIGCIILLITKDQVPLQYMAVFSQAICYLTSSVAALYAVKTAATKRLSLAIPLFSILSCLVILGICLGRLISFGLSASFLIVLGVGFVLALCKR